jgi:hypothetical protein
VIIVRTAGHRPRAQDDGVDRGISGAGEPRGGHASERAEHQHGACGDRAAAQRGGQPRVAERDVRADGEHQHREPHVPEELHGGVRRVDRIQTGTPDDHAREDLADHHGNERAAPGAQERARKTRQHDERQYAEVHRLRLRRPDDSEVVRAAFAGCRSCAPARHVPARRW